jgi:hypothetical protein
MGWVVNAPPRPLYPRENPGTHCIGGWVDPRAGLNGCGKSRPTGIRSPDRPVLSESLYRLRYTGPPYAVVPFGRFGANRILRKSWVWPYMCSWNPNSNALEQDRPQHDLTHLICYRPAIFFRHLFLVPLSFPHRKLWRILKIIIISIFLLLKLRKSEIA